MKSFYLFDGFRVDTTERLLFKENREVPLTPKVFDTLLVLLENSSHVLTKKELMHRSGPTVLSRRTTWPKTFPSCAKHSAKVRKANTTFRQFRSEAIASSRRQIAGAEEETWSFVNEPGPESSSNVTMRDDAVTLPPGARVIDVSPAEVIHKLEQRPPETMYARSGDVNIAYQVIGDAPLDLVFVMGWVSHMEYFWREPSFARFLLRLASFSRLILFDKRGTGLSDRVPINQLPTLEQRMDDVRAVMDAVGSERAALCGVSEGGPMCSLFAATYPEKTLRARHDRDLRKTSSRRRVSVGTDCGTARTVFRSDAEAVGWSGRD